MDQFEYEKNGIRMVATREAMMRALAVELMGQPRLQTIHLGSPTPPIGKYWPGQGGIYVGMARGFGDVPDYPMVTSIGQEGGYLENIEYGPRIEVKGADDFSDGWKNTQALVKAGKHPAAELAAKFTADGHSDFCLPARAQGALCYANLAGLDLLKTDDWHWLSTQIDRNDAWCQGFSDGSQHIGIKGNTRRVCFVRRVCG